MITWLSANLINIVLVAVIVLVVGFLVQSMIRDRRAGKHSCGGSCAACGACSGCRSCAECLTTKTEQYESNGKKM